MRFLVKQIVNDSEAFQNEPSELNLLSIVSLAAIPESRKKSDNWKPKVADGFERIQSAPGFELFSNGIDFVAAVDLHNKGSLRMIAGEQLGPGGKSATGGRSPEFRRMTSAQAMDKSQSLNSASKCVFNGSFFANQNETKAQIAFPLKVNGKVVSEGFAPLAKHRGKRMALEIFEHGARIEPFKNEDIKALKNSGAKDAIVSLAPDVDIDGRKQAKTGRTFIGLDRKQESGLFRRALIFVSPDSSQLHAELTLKRFGAQRVMMLDGGGSAQLRCGARELVGQSNRARSVPQFISIENQ
jgi:hypothetical protein